MIRVDCQTLESYYNYLFSNEQEFRKFLDSFTINYTFFFRDWEVYNTFQNFFLTSLNCKVPSITSKIKPDPSQLAQFRTNSNYLKNLKKKLLKSSTDSNYSYLPMTSLYQKINKPRSLKNKIKIWSCPCASGEEPYTIAMILENLSQQIANFPKYDIVASDIDNDAILKALTGIYRETAMKEITNFYKTKYFTKIQQRYKSFEYLLSEKLKQHIEFINEDVTKGHKKSNFYDIIFCRYLLIYFNRQNRDSFIRIINKHLNYGGLLILGKTETLYNYDNKYSDLKLIDLRNQIYLKSKNISKNV